MKKKVDSKAKLVLSKIVIAKLSDVSMSQLLGGDPPTVKFPTRSCRQCITNRRNTCGSDSCQC